MSVPTHAVPRTSPRASSLTSATRPLFTSSSDPDASRPDSSKPTSGTKPESAAKPDENRRRVLIVEDDVTSASAIRSILTRKGCDVAVAHTVHKGLNALNSDLDFVILDLMLPDGDGIEVLSRCHEDFPRIKVVITTAVSDSTQVRKVLELKPHRLLRKPIDLVDLLSGIGMM